MINGPSRMVMLLAPSKNNISFDLWGFDDVELTPPNQSSLSDQRSHYFLQFIQGINPRYAYILLNYMDASAGEKIPTLNEIYLSKTFISFYRPQRFWIMIKVFGENVILNKQSEFIELSLTGHFDNGKVLL